MRLAQLVPPLLAVAVAAAALAQPPAAARTPEELTRAYSDAMARHDLGALARLTHPRALAQVRQLVGSVAGRDTSGRALQQLAGVGSAQALAALPDSVLFTRFIGALLGRQPGMRDLMRGSRTEVLGHVSEGGDTAHVVYRLHVTVNGVPMSRLNVLSAQRDAAGWRALLSGDVNGMVQALNQPARP